MEVFKVSWIVWGEGDYIIKMLEHVNPAFLDA